MGTNVDLTLELERFAQACVETGRFNNVSEVVRSALRMLQDAEARKAAFVARAVLAASAPRVAAGGRVDRPRDLSAALGERV